MLIKLWSEYIIIWINDSGRETVDAFATEQCQMIRRCLCWVYWDIYLRLLFNIETTRSILKTGNLGKQYKKICCIPLVAWDEPLRRVTIYCYYFVEDTCDIFQFLPYLLHSILWKIFFFYFAFFVILML